MQHLIQQRTRRGIDVQRRDPAPQRQRHKRVAALGDAPPQPPSLAAEDDHHAAAVVRRRVVERARRGDRAVAPAAGAPRREQEVSEVACARDPQVLDRTG